MQKTLSNPTILPPELQKVYQKTDKDYVALMNSGLYVEAIAVQKNLYEQLLQRQDRDNLRFHKGGPLHNIGFTHVYLNNLNIALEYFLFAFTEDVLTTTQLPEDPIEMPAAQNLLNFYKVTRESLLEFKDRILEANKKVEIRDPIKQKSMLIKSEQAAKKEIEKVLENKPKITQWYDISHIPGELDKRVFVGGKYGGDLETIDLIKDAVIKKGYIAIIARECKMDSKNMPKQTYLLLHNCKYAIFDLTVPGGQIAEQLEADHYGTVKLLICQENFKDKVTAMIDGKQIKTFENEKELRDIIREFLP